jgi:uncharacterized protein YbaP (TraB family)
MLMKKIFFAVVALLTAAIGNAQTKQVSKESNSLLWKISGKGLTKPSYLFGTMHILCAEDIKISENFRNVINGSDLIYFEVDMDNMMEILGSLRYLKMSDNKKLSDLLSAEDYQKVKDYFTKNAGMIPFPMMESFKPFFLSSMMSDQSMDCPSKEGMETAIMKEAKTSNKEIKGLETIQFQASVFDSIPYERQAKELVKAIDSPSSDVDHTKELVAVYKAQDLDKIQSMTVQEDGVLSEYLDLLLYNRNANWAGKMAQLMPANSILFAVGAAHLPGDKGVIALLKKSGYTVTPVANN